MASTTRGSHGYGPSVTDHETASIVSGTELIAAREDVQNAIEDVVASAIGSEVQPGTLKITADDAQAHCT